MPRTKQTTLRGRGFATGDVLTQNQLQSLITNGPGPGSTSSLKALSWNGKIVGSLVLWLSNDNAMVHKGLLSLAGDFLPDPIILPAKKLWPDVPDTISISLTLSSPDQFIFQDSLVSDYGTEEVIIHHFFRNNQASNSTLSEEQLIEHGVGSFCLRLFVYPSSSTWVSFSLLIYPEALSELKDHALYSNPKWPGLLLADGKFPLFPSSTMFKTKWGSPILPLIVPGAPLDSLPSLPPNSVLLAPIASILRTATLPETKRMGEALLARWAELDQHGAGALDSSLPTSVWPEFSAPFPSSGSFCCPLFVRVLC